MTKALAKGRLQLLMIGVVFVGPLLIAYLLYGGGWAPDNTTEHGDILRPPASLPDVALTDAGRESAPKFRGMWSLIVFNEGRCANICRTALHETRQIRLALGRDRDRVQRLLYMASGSYDPDFIRSDHPGLIVLESGSAAGQALATAAGVFEAGDIFLADPLGNLIMRFPEGTGMRGVHEDLKKLLKISRIG